MKTFANKLTTLRLNLVYIYTKQTSFDVSPFGRAFMKRLLASCASLLLLVPLAVEASEFSAGGLTLLRLEQRDIGSETKRIAPLTQFARLDAAGIGSEALSLHIAGWGRADLADESTSSDTLAGTLEYGYMQYRHPTANARIRVGRFLHSEGGVMEHVDGISLRSDLLHDYSGLAASLYAGVPVSQNKGTSVRGSSIFGGRLSHRVEKIMELGLFASQETGMLRTGPDTDLKDYRRIMGGDLWLLPLESLEIEGRTQYDAAGNGFAESLLRLSWQAAKSLSVTGSYRQNDLKALYSSTNLRSLFNPNTDEKSKQYAGSATYSFQFPLQLTVDASTTDRDSRSNSARLGFDLRSVMSEKALIAGLGFHHVSAGDLKTGQEGVAATDYSEFRHFITYGSGSFTAGYDMVAHLYADEMNGKKSGYEIMVTGGYKVTPIIRLSADVTVADTPQAEREVRGLIRLACTYEKGAGK